MKRITSTLVLAFAIGFCIQSVRARSTRHSPQKTHPAPTTQTFDSAATETFAGSYRSGPKTSIARNGTSVAQVTTYNNLHSLLVTLPKDTAMRNKYPALQKGLMKGWPAVRELEEIRNVRIKSCWLVSAKHEGDPKGDHDFHVIVSNSPTDFTEVMNAEVSALPMTHTADFNKLKDVRAVFLSFSSTPPSANGFGHMTPPKHVTLEGSLYFDGAHGAGGKSDPGPGWAKPQSVWEIHPIYTITSLN
jgi:hypothetical protein